MPATDAGPPASAGRVLGTAGHIDHGKTALIRALTGVETDRLPEEQARGITIELGFAPLDLANGQRVGVVDVPGHEGLVRTMVAGATGIDAVLLVVAADEGVMPQTREHLAICQLLGIESGVAALSKIDVADPDVAELAEAELRELLDAGPLASAPILRVSSLTGAGVPELAEALADCVARSGLRRRQGPPRLFIDRVFGMRGFGTVVTGTLQGSALAVGDAVELLPGGRRARVRGLESHGRAAERVEPGARCALNLQGLELGEVSRGQVVTHPDRLQATASADGRVTWLAAAPPLEGPTQLAFLAGTSERLARVTPLGGQPLRPGAEGYVRLHFEGDPLPLLPGDAFVLRGFARIAGGGWTLGGGTILDPAPARRRPSDPVLVRELAQLAGADPAAGLAVRVARAGYAGVSDRELAQAHALARPEVAAQLAPAQASGALARVPPDRWLSAEARVALEARLLQALEAFHTAEPLQPGMTRGALRGRLPQNVGHETAEWLISRLAERGDVAVDGDRVARAGHVPTLSDGDRRLADRIAEDAAAAALAPPALREWLERLAAPESQVRDLLAHLVREGRLVRAPSDLWFDADAVTELRRRVVAHLRSHGSLDTAGYKELVGGTRKHVVPLMELLDGEGLTRRRGDVRVLHRPPE